MTFFSASILLLRLVNYEEVTFTIHIGFGDVILLGSVGGDAAGFLLG